MNLKLCSTRLGKLSSMDRSLVLHHAGRIAMKEVITIGDRNNKRDESMVSIRNAGNLSTNLIPKRQHLDPPASRGCI